jgi:methylase of polypeptide subunit release factors
MQLETVRSSGTINGYDAREAIPSFAFDPSDPWTMAFQAGLRHAGLSGKRVYEVGVGSGTNVLFMLRHCAASLVQGSDLDPRLPMLTQRLITEVAPDLADRVRLIQGSVSLIDAPLAMAAAAAADVIVACLPQVPDPREARYARFHAAQLKTLADTGHHMDDHMAHYYPWGAFDDYPFNSVGLGLIEALLSRARSSASQAQVILTLGCRIGKGILVRLFQSNCYQPEVLVSRIVKQDERTDISFFVALEAAMRGTGYEKDFGCEFYTDPEGRSPISASEAKARLDAGQAMPLFHEVCVMRGYPQAWADMGGRYCFKP